MASSLAISTNVTSTGGQVTDNTTRFSFLGGHLNPQPTEANVETPIREAGTFRNLFANVIQNDVNSATSCTITLRKSRADTAVIVSYTNNQTGIKEDTSNSVSFAATDEANYEITVTAVSGTHTVTVSVIGCQFDPTATSKCITHAVAGGTNTFSTASVSRFLPWIGTCTTGNSSHGPVDYVVHGSYSLTNLWCNVSSNARTTDTVIRNVSGVGDGNNVFSYTSGQTGQKEDTTHTESYFEGGSGGTGQSGCYSFATNTGAGNIVFTNFAAMLASLESNFILMAGNGAGVTVNFNVTTYFGICGDLNPSTTEADGQYRARAGLLLRQFHVYFSANSIGASGQTTVRVRDNGSNGNESVVFNAGDVTIKEDLVNNDFLASSTDLFNFQIVTPNTSGSVTVTMAGVQAQFQPLGPRALCVKQAVNRASTY